MPSPILYLIRHGETDWNAERRLQGQQDIPLNGKGRAQAQRNGERLREIIADPSSYRFVASPLGRARQTMEIVRTAMELPFAEYATEEALREISFGDWEGSTLEELYAVDPVMVKGRKKNKWRFLPPGGESYAKLAERSVPFVKSLAADTVIVSHGGTMRTIIQHLENAGEEEMANFLVPQDRFYRWDGRSGKWI